MTNSRVKLTRGIYAGLTMLEYYSMMDRIVDRVLGPLHLDKTLSVSSTNKNTMKRYRITAVEIDELGSESNQTIIAKEIEIYSQTLTDLNLSVLIKALNPTTRKRRAKKEVSA